MHEFSISLFPCPFSRASGISMELPALLSLLLGTDNPFLSTANRTMLPSFLGCHIEGFASSSFCRLKLFAFLEHDNRMSFGGH